MKISVFGATGFIGSRFCELYPAVPIPRGEFTYFGDNALYLISTTHNYDTWRVNVDTNISVLYDHLACSGNATFNFVSSWFVYGESNWDSVDIYPISESWPPNPKGGNYNLTKRWAEQMVIDYCYEREIPYRIFRLANVFGKGDKFSEKKNALQYLINEMENDRDIYLYNDGYFYRDYIHVDDVCEMLYKGMEILPVNEIYNVGSGRPILFRDMILLAHSVLGSKSNISSMEPTEFHKRIQVKDFWMDTGKINSYGIICKSSPYERLYRMVKDES